MLGWRCVIVKMEDGDGLEVRQAFYMRDLARMTRSHDAPLPASFDEIHDELRLARDHVVMDRSCRSPNCSERRLYLSPFCLGTGRRSNASWTHGGFNGWSIVMMKSY